MSLIKSAGKLTIANVSKSILGFLGIVIFTRQVGASELGVFFLFQAVVGICAIGADFGINDAVKKRISEGENQGEFLLSAILLKISSTSIISILILLSRDYIAAYLGVDFAYLLIITLFVQQFANVSVSTLHGEIRVGETAPIEVMQQVVWVGTGVLLTTLNPTATSLIEAYILAALSKLVYAWHLKQTTVSFPNSKQVGSLFDYSKFSLISSVGGYLYSWMDVLIIGYFLTSEFVAAYEVAWRVSGVIVILSRSVSLSIFPRVSDWSVDNAVDEISRVITDATTTSLMICIPAFSGTVLLSTEILQFVFDEEYTIAALAMIILMFEKTFQAVHQVWGHSLQAIDRPDQAASAAVVSIIVNMMLNLLLVPAYELEGAATATAISFLLNTALHARYLNRSVPIRMEWNKIGWSILSAFIMSAIVYVVSEIVNIDSIATLLVLISVGILTYFAILPIYPPIKTDLSTVFSALTP